MSGKRSAHNKLVENHQKQQHKKRPNIALKIGLLIVACILAFVAGFGLTAAGVTERAVETFKSWWVREDQTVTVPEESENNEEENWDELGEPVEPAKPEEKPVDGPGKEPEQDYSEKPEGENGIKDPVIYVGQVLIIPGFQGGGTTVSQVIHSGTLSSGKKQIALTFDSGWLYEQTIPLLNVLDRCNAVATFFPRALWVKEHPDLGREIVRRGHSMGNHSLTHPYMDKLTAAEIYHEIRESTRIIQEITGVRPYLFRPPYGAYNRQVLEILAEEGYPYTIMWTVDTLDWAAGTTRKVAGREVYIDADFIVNRVLENATEKGIVLMHVGGSSTVEALPRIIEGLRSKGFDLVTVDAMLPPPQAGIGTHIVSKGETLYSIARRYGVSVQQLIDTNNLR